MGDRIKNESYWYWLRACFWAAVPQAQEWRGAIDLAHSLAFAVGAPLLRLLILLTSPISVPLLAAWAVRANRRAVEAREKARTELLNSLHSLQPKDPS